MTLNDMIPNVSVEPGKSGDVTVARFEVSRQGASIHNMRAIVHGNGHRGISTGTYTKMLIRGRLVMSDTPAEKRDHWGPVHHAQGHCLILGLGLGMVVNAIALKPEVTKVTVIEISPDVVALVAPSLHPKINVVVADALEWKPPKGESYGVVWADIWSDLCTDNRPEMTKLKRRYSRRSDWVGCWADAEVARQQKRDCGL